MSQALLAGMEGVFIPVKNPKISAEWYEEKIGFKPIYIEDEAAVMKIEEGSQTVVCLMRTVNHQPMKFPENNFGEGVTKFFTFFDLDGNSLGVCK